MEKVRARGFTLEMAIDIARMAHDGYWDKAGMPYILHPLAVMVQLEGEKARIAGALHDVVEDTGMTFKELAKLGCPLDIIASLRLVTHSKNFKDTEEEYMKEIHMIADSGDQTAIDVKWADLMNNSDKSRNHNPKKEDLERLKKYKRSQDVLRPYISNYLKAREISLSETH
jgi:(p)ppGpp synthase/HD superfamily hydrolase